MPRRVVAVLAVILALGALVAAHVALWPHGQASQASAAICGTDAECESVPPCSPDEAWPWPCVWDAQSMGNGEGQSYRVDEHGEVTYV